MSRRPKGGSGQPELFVRSNRPAISLPNTHPIMVLTDRLDWTEMEVRVQKIRERKLKNAAFGLNLTKLTRGAAAKREIVLAR